MKNKLASKSLLNSCLLASLACLPWTSSASAQSAPGVFSKLNVGNGTGSTTGDGTFVAEGLRGVSPVLGPVHQTAGSRMLWYPRKSAFRAGYGDTNSWLESTIGDSSVAMGYNNVASGYASTAMGYYGNTASGSGSTAMGYYMNTASGYGSTAMGYNNTASGFASTAMGYNNTASGTGSTALGVYTSASSLGSTVVGLYNASTPGNQYSWSPKDPVFQIGNGHWGVYESEVEADLNGDGDIDLNWEVYIPETYSNALTVYKNGNMELQGNLTLGGTITSAGSPVLTQSTASASYLAVNPSAILGAGATLSNGGLIAMGNSAQAIAYESVAIGSYASATAYGSLALGIGSRCSESAYNSAALVGGIVTKGNSLAVAYGEANGELSFAFGGGVTSGDSSIALGGYDYQQSNWPGNQSTGDGSTTIGGVGNVAAGFSSFASGFWTKAASYGSVSLGSLNLGLGSTVNGWAETDSLFELGNGNSVRSSSEPPASDRSNAITTLKNGQTTLTNKAWSKRVIATVSATADPSTATTDSDGNALVVDGHTVLNGKVIITVPQGDISMGIYR